MAALLDSTVHFEMQQSTGRLLSIISIIHFHWAFACVACNLFLGTISMDLFRVTYYSIKDYSVQAFNFRRGLT